MTAKDALMEIAHLGAGGQHDDASRRVNKGTFAHTVDPPVSGKLLIDVIVAFLEANVTLANLTMVDCS
jgi:hypothetical protein